jgi:hypothetical protein
LWKVAGKIKYADADGTFLCNDAKLQDGLCRSNFIWQEGYGGFSYSKSQIQGVYDYIRDQEIHHHKRTFREEYLDFLEKSGVEYNEKYLFESPRAHSPWLATELASIKYKIPIWGSKIPRSPACQSFTAGRLLRGTSIPGLIIL